MNNNNSFDKLQILHPVQIVTFASDCILHIIKSKMIANCTLFTAHTVCHQNVMKCIRVESNQVSLCVCVYMWVCHNTISNNRMHLFVSVWKWNKQKKWDTTNRKAYQKQSILNLTMKIVKPRKIKNSFEKYIWIKRNKQREFISNKTHSWMIIIIKRIWIERRAALSS